MGWSHAVWLNNKIRIPERNKRLVAVKNNIIAVYTAENDNVTSFTFTFTPKYTGVINIITQREVGTSAMGAVSSITVNGSIIYPYETTEASRVTMWFAIPVTANNTITVNVNYSHPSSSINATRYPVFISAAVCEQTY